jgi:hypothetical protein
MHLRLALLATAALATHGFAQNNPQANVDDLVAKNIEAKGGAQALHALTSLKINGKMVVNDGRLQMAFSQVKKRPEDVRSEVTLQGMTAVQAYDGTTGWKIMPFQGRKDPEKMSADDVKSLQEEADIDGPLVNWKEKGSTVEYLGTEDIDGTQAHKLKVSKKNGDIVFVYLDPDHFLEIRTITQRTEHGAQMEFETDYGDYEKVGGVFIPLASEGGVRGSTDKQKVVIEKAEPNVAVDESVFHFPPTAVR